jgi:DNA-binding transcriptional ArsR family regulator
LGARSRREIVELLRTGPLPVGELAQRLPISRPAVSQHLRVLKEAGLVHEVTRGTRHYYELDRSGLELVRDYLDRFWDSALARFAQLAAAQEAAPDLPHRPAASSPAPSASHADPDSPDNPVR